MFLMEGMLNQTLEAFDPHKGQKRPPKGPVNQRKNGSELSTL